MIESHQTSPPLHVPAVIVAHFPDPGLLARARAVRAQFEPAIIHDNSTNADARNRVTALAEKAGCEYATTAANLGIAGALNRHFAALEQRGLPWCAAFDQDSLPDPGVADHLLACARPDADSRPPAVVGANWYDLERPDHRSRHLQPHPRCPWLYRRVAADGDLDVTCVITSGSLFHLPAWRALGGFDESLFLDLVDSDYCLRARAAGYAVRVAANARLQHRRGAKRPVRLLGRTWWPAFMPSPRLRYLFRNRILLFRRHGRRAPHWVAYECAYGAKILAEILFLEDRKPAKLGACLRGTWDGVRGRRGQIAGVESSRVPASAPAP